MTEFKNSNKTIVVHAEDDEGNFLILKVDDICVISYENPVFTYQTKDKTYFSLHTDKAIEQCNADLKARHNENV